jgi:acetyl-CoA C-acetyltransferase
MSAPVFILGGYQTDFARNATREELDIFALMREAVSGAIEAAQIDVRDVEVGHVGNFVGEMFTGQGMLGGFFGHIHPELAGVPASRHEGACASGSLAILAAMSDIESGRYDVACVTGIEYMRNVPARTASSYLGAAAWVGEEAQGVDFVWPAMFSDLADEYDRRYGLKREHLAAIGRKNFANAKRNPLAQTRNWVLTDAHFTDDEELNPVVEGWMRRHDCSQITDGAVTIFLASEAWAKRHCARTGQRLEDLARIEGWGHTTAPMRLATKLSQSADQDYVLPWTRKAITDAYSRAGIAGPEALDAIETHDCFTMSEYAAIEHFGITAPGEAWKAIEDGRTELSGAIPVNPSGGLIGLGHPVGATGVRMMLDAARQVTGRADAMQVGGAQRVGIFNVGGSGTTNCAFVVGRGG